VVQQAAPRYDLSDEELDLLELELVQRVRECVLEPEVVAAWIAPTLECANFVRTYEARHFPEVTGVSQDDEDRTLFLALVDCRENPGRVVHSATVCGVGSPGSAHSSNGNLRDPVSSGFICIDELVALGNFTTEEFFSHYKARGIDLKTCISVETHFRIGDLAPPWCELSMAEIMYYCLFDAVRQAGGGVDKSAVFATINQPQSKSFTRVGLRCEPVMDRVDLVTPEAELGVESRPVALIYDSHAEELFAQLAVPVKQCTI